MKERYVCWDVENEDDPGENPRERNIVENFSAEWAAEEYAERVHADSDWVDKMAIAVRDAAGVVHTVDVEVEAVASFSGWVRS